jgi:predicted nucleotidyltransferase
MIDAKEAIVAMASRSVEFVLIGGIALNLHAAAYLTYDLDFCYSRTHDNLDRIVEALASFKPRLRGFPADLPFIWDSHTLSNGTVFTLETDIGEIDLLGEVAGIGTYVDVLAASEKWNIHGFEINVLSIEGLIRAKKAAGRPKDVEGIKLLEALRESESEDDE